jgi:hypothetical protein
MSEAELLEYLAEEVRMLRNKAEALTTRVAVLENTWALALKWGAGAGAAVATTIAVLEKVL